MDALLKAGNELIEGRENAPGSKDVQEEMDMLKNRLDHLTHATNDRQKVLESNWNNVKHFNESVSSLNVQLKRKLKEIDVLMKPGADPKDVYNDLKVCEFSILLVTLDSTTTRILFLVLYVGLINNIINVI